MKSQWYELKPAALVMRKNGKSLRFIELNLGIPRSTLSGWYKNNVVLTDNQQTTLNKARLVGLTKARTIAARQHYEQKLARYEKAEKDAKKTLEAITLTPEILELSLAMLYWGEGKKSQTTALGAADPLMLKCFLSLLERCFEIRREVISCQLNLRHDQNAQKEITYWSSELHIPLANFKNVYFDKRTRGSTYSTYHGICLLHCSNVAIQRKLAYLYKSFCEKLLSSDILGD